jgi:hypothetical protein
MKKKRSSNTCGTKGWGQPLVDKPNTSNGHTLMPAFAHAP